MNKMVLPCRGNIIMKKYDKNQPISPTLKIKLNSSSPKILDAFDANSVKKGVSPSWAVHVP